MQAGLDDGLGEKQKSISTWVTKSTLLAPGEEQHG